MACGRTTSRSAKGDLSFFARAGQASFVRFADRQSELSGDDPQAGAPVSLLTEGALSPNKQSEAS